jgi:response regulator of citrate/malate metabolism
VFGGSAPDAATLPKGHSTFTVERVREALRTAPGPLPAIEVAAQAGPSRQTAQRYLRLLERTGRVRMSLRYGEIT